MNNPYATLGVKPESTQEEIQRAYRAKAAELHPDKPTGDEEKFKDLNAAYTLLSDESSRSIYDATGMVLGEDPESEQAMMLLAEMAKRILIGEPTAPLKDRLARMLDDEEKAAEGAATNARQAETSLETRWKGSDGLKRIILGQLHQTVSICERRKRSVQKAREILKGVRYELPRQIRDCIYSDDDVEMMIQNLGINRLGRLRW